MDNEMSTTIVDDPQVTKCKDCKFNITASRCTVYTYCKPRTIRRGGDCEFHEKVGTLPPEDLEAGAFNA
jgi:hypothetical protein